MQLYYADAPLEKASLYILSKLGVEILVAQASAVGLTAKTAAAEHLTIASTEHMHVAEGKRIGYVVTKG